MSNFKQFADAINKKFLELASNGTLLRTNVSKEELWNTYQNSYSPKDNPIFREKKVHECNTCYSFIKRLGPVVGVINGKLDTIWNVSGLPTPYQEVANLMHSLVSSHGISSIFLTNERLVGKEYNIEASEAGNIKWDHFYASIDETFISSSPAIDIAAIESTVSIFNRALETFSIDTLAIVVELCDSIYKGEEFQPTVSKFLSAKEAYNKAPDKSVFIWTQYNNYPAKIRNSAIGTLLIDIQKGIDLEEAVAKYEKVVAPNNYKRTSAVVTESMKKEAKATIQKLGITDSLTRRHATLKDLSVNNLLFTNSSAQSSMKDTLDDILDTAVSKIVEPPKTATEIPIKDFIKDILPNSTKIELLLENRHMPNMVSLVAPVNPDAPNIFKWSNNFSWSYVGEVTDSMKNTVKNAGGSVTGDLRFSIQWNEDGSDGKNDLDAHCYSPLTHIDYTKKLGDCGGKLDVDITNPVGDSRCKNGVAVENITWDSIKCAGTYDFKVNNFAGVNIKGFRAEIEILGEVFEYNYNRPLMKSALVASVQVDKNGKLEKIKHHIKQSSSSKNQWDLNTKEYQNISTIMLSPNHWDGNASGNKHYFFMLDDCVNPDPVRGFYNEFLSEEFRPHRKVFEVLSSKMKCTPEKEQLSGLGFSSTQKNDVFVKVDNRPYKIKF